MSERRVQPGGEVIGRGHLPVLDGVRGLAILMVLALHFVADTEPATRLERAIALVAGWGQYGVDLFFVLSGFLITGILVDARERPDYFRNFYLRRVLRIFPLYYAVLAVLFLVLPRVPGLASSTLDALRAHQAWAWLYGVNVYLAWKGEWALSYLDHFWSLSVEEHFYFVWPFVVWALARRPRALLLTSVGLAAAALLGRVLCAAAGIGPHVLYVLTPFRLDGLALGGAFAALARRPGGMERIRWLLPRLAAAAGALFGVRFLWSRLTPLWSAPLFQVRESLLVVLLACLLLRALTAPCEAPVVRAFSSRTMRWFGTYSYGLYVYHHFLSFYFSSHKTEHALAARLGSHALAVALQAVVGVGVSCAVAFASYHLLEKRFLALKDRLTGGEQPRASGALGVAGPSA
ncbi:MAG TPA: acyltransferase [Myxococcaceae bacterium]|nr:acyltransferase [Myxococcaceae bacterium]